MISREIVPLIQQDFRRKKVIVILGARQVGKTTLLEQIGSPSAKTLSLNCDNADDCLLLTGKTSTELAHLLSPYDIVYIDEAQRVTDIGLTIKKIADLKLNSQIIVTGSSSLDITDRINEPATGRTIDYNLYPLSMSELASLTSMREENRLLPTRLVYGMYPEVITEPSDAKRTLIGLSNNYLYKDILSYRGIKKPELVYNLAKALALQLGSEVSYNELSRTLGVDKETVENYINLLEKCFIIYKLPSFSRNMRNEIKKGKKIYFYDNGIRNAIISNFSPLESRNDTGALWENFIIGERIKRNHYDRNYSQLYFWRTHEQSEIDLIEEADGQLHAYEFKWNKSRKAKTPASFEKNYPEATFDIITPENFRDFILPRQNAPLK